MNENVQFEEATRALWIGSITYEEYIAATRERWEAMARWLMRSWRLPVWVELEDIVQEFFLAARNYVWTYEAGRGKQSIGRYVRIMSVYAVKRRIHSLRGAKLYGNPDRRPSVIEQAFSTMSLSQEMEVDATFATPPKQEYLVQRTEISRQLERYCSSDEELAVLRALAVTDSLRGSAVLLYEHKESRDALGLQDEEHASLVVMKAAKALAMRSQQAAA